MRTNFFQKPAPELPRKTLNLPSFGEITLEKMDTAKIMRFQALSAQKVEYYQSNIFPAIGNRDDIEVSKILADCCAALTIMQVRRVPEHGLDAQSYETWLADNKPYSFEEFVASAITAEDEFNLLTIAANELNNLVSVPKAKTESILGESSTLAPNEA
jgi:hypothetical protein